jgi:hypothetical protein
MPKPNREIAITAKGSGGSQRGTLCRWEALTSAATTAAIATPKKIPRARFGCLRQAAPHKARNSTRPLICSHIAMIQKSSRRRDSWRLARLPRSYSTSTPGRAESALARVAYRAHRFRLLVPSRRRAGAAKRTHELCPVPGPKPLGWTPPPSNGISVPKWKCLQPLKRGWERPP